MGRTRQSADLVSENNIFVDISTDRVGVGSTQPTSRLDVSGNIKAVGLVTSTQGYYVNGTPVINSSGVWVGSSSGLQGAQGTTGTQGTTGAQGTTGTTGTQGTTGAQGIQGRQGIQGSTGLNTWSKKTTSYTAVNGDRLIADTSGGTFTITLPATPSTGHSVVIADGASWSSTNLTIGRNGSTIEGAAENLNVDVGGITLELIYDGTTWEVFTSNGPQGIQGVQGVQGVQGIQGVQGVQGGNARGLAILAYLSPG